MIISNLEYNTFEQQLFPPWYFSPACIIERFIEIYDHFGSKSVMNDRDFKKARELWSAAMFGLFLNNLTKINHWVRPEYGDFPDVFLYNYVLRPDDKGIEQRIINLEITDLDSNSKETTFDVISKKVKKVKSNDTVLLVHLKQPNVSVDIAILRQKVHSLKISFSQILLLSNTVGNTADNISIIELFPGYKKWDFPFIKLLNQSKKQTEIIHPQRGAGTEIKKIGWYKIHMPIKKIGKS